MSSIAIERLLQDEIGLHSSTVGSKTISQAVDKRMRACAIDSTDDYYRILKESATELSALIDTAVIPETWFYRDRNAFTAFSEWVREQCPSLAHPLRILSVPCSTGEEPYTIAMCLADCGATPDAVQLDAVDISSTSLDRARNATYGRNSFRGSDLLFQTRHFEKTDDGYRLHDKIRRRVSFAQGNILDDAFFEGRDSYDVIFCRNLLIYFERKIQHDAIDRLQRLLKKGGLLFLGHSETALLRDRPFRAIEFPRCFGFRFTVAEESGREPVTPVKSPEVPRRRPPNRAPQSRPNPFADVDLRTGDAANGTDKDKDPLQHAFSLADAGHIDEAAIHCERLIVDEPDRADAFYLLGLIREAAGNHRESESLFRKAVYLDPDHYEALAHLAIVCETNRKPDSARQFRERARRVQARIGSRKVNT